MITRSEQVRIWEELVIACFSLWVRIEIRVSGVIVSAGHHGFLYFKHTAAFWRCLFWISQCRRRFVVSPFSRRIPSYCLEI